MSFNFHGNDFLDSSFFFVLGYITKSTIMICPFVKIYDFLFFFFLLLACPLCQSRVEEAKNKNKKRTLLKY